MAIPGAGAVHSILLIELERAKREYRLDEERTPRAQLLHVHGKVDSVLYAKTAEELYAMQPIIKDNINVFILYAWGKGWAKGPETPERLEEEAKKKVSFAKWQKELGGDKNMERAKKALGEAAEIRKRIEWLLRQKE